MGDFPVDNSELALYFVFTLLSILVSLIIYCYYQHFSPLSVKDHQERLNIFVAIA